MSDEKLHAIAEHRDTPGAFRHRVLRELSARHADAPSAESTPEKKRATVRGNPSDPLKARAAKSTLAVPPAPRVEDFEPRVRVRRHPLAQRTHEADPIDATKPRTRMAVHLVV